MHVFETVPKQWGNSMGITIPKEIVKDIHIRPHKKIRVLILNTDNQELKKAFGTITLKKPLQEIMNEIDEGYDE